MASSSSSNSFGGVAGVNGDLWRECVAWLTRCKVIPPDHKAAQPDAEIRILAMTLRDGVLLCNLVIHLDPSSLDPREFNRKPQMAQFLCSKNIKLFLDVCHNNFGIRDADLFEPTMLYDLTNFHRVLITLSKLSQCRKVQQLHPDLIGFNLQLSPTERSHSDEAIYKDLHSTDLNMRKTSSIDASASSSAEYYDRTSQSGSLDENSDITIENGTEDIDDYIEDSLSNMCDSTIDNDAEDAGVETPLLSDCQGSHVRELSFDLALDVVSSTTDGASNAVTPTPESYARQSQSPLAAAAPSVPVSAAPGPPMGRLVSTSSSSSSLLVSESQRLQRAAAAVYNYRSSMASTEHEYAYIYSEDDEKVYEDLCYVTFQAKAKPETASSTSFEQRDYVIRELIDTESNYLDVLTALKTKFMGPLERHLNQDELRLIFPRIRELVDIHTKFLDKLRESLTPNAKVKMAQVFLDFREPFLIYGEFCSLLLGAIDYLADVCKKNQIIDQLVQKCERDYNVGKLQLRDILSVPMQRILKYHLLLDKLVKETSPLHDDYRSLERAKEAMIDVSQYINEVKRDSDHLVIIQKVKDSICDIHLLQNGNGSDLLQYGRLLLDGELHIKAHEDQKTKLRYAFVFDKILIMVKALHIKTGDMQYTYRDSHNLADYRVEQSHSRRTIGRDTRFKYQLLLARKSGKTAFTLYLKSEHERDKWRKALTEAMESLEPPGCQSTDHKMEIYTFDAPTTCRHCSKFLKGRIHQGYRCKVCQISVHKGCISSTGRCKQNPVSVPPPVCDRQLSEFNWFAGNMDRETAAHRLENRRIGTYLLRVRPQGPSTAHETMYALSLKTDDNVIKHMKINQENSGDSMLYCLSSRRHFKTIVELVSYYERNDLGENFAGLNQSLQWPYKEVIATALYDYEPKAGSNQLQLRTDCQVLVIGKDGDSKGWWRGKIGDTVGYFPKEYVQEQKLASEEL
uniref:Vav guanine nucleotide exchange factor, isoform D n=1 Tax=Drosophila melanogaster TaxID=7227 RepID=M9PHJ6_DROME|nr:Vav guanine nucleotide exchange factor, isoform D [Drosophila melanogaster]AGB95543.1 Vav guanine nucleotide exchange factor, isoform D [Drosophila melanogaster]|eukprot:NP_001259703.1 Vav guanine nucleotide exchange factor, isoform D [Drosophila melanogaster]